MHLHLRRHLLGWLCVAASSLILAAPASANPFGTQHPLGSLLTATEVERPAIAAGDGRSLVVWREEIQDPGSRGRGIWQIGGRVVDDTGAPLGDAFVIGEGGDGRPSRPDVAYNADHDEFLVTWRGFFGGGVLVAQRIDGAGGKLGDRITVVNTGSGVDEVARAAWASTVDEYLVVWDQQNFARDVGSRIFGLRLDGETGVPFNAEVPLLLSDGLEGEVNPDVAFDAPSGKWLAAFEGRPDEKGQSETLRGEQPDEVYVNTVTPAEAIGTPELVSTTGDAVSRPAVAANTVDGGFAVTWSRQEHEVERVSFSGDVVARLVDANGDGVGDEVDVSSKTDLAYGASPAIAHDENSNEYLIVWWHHNFALPRGDAPTDEVMGRRYSKSLAPLTDAQLVSLVDVPITRGSDLVEGAEQPVAAYSRKSCAFVSAYEVVGFSTNVASRGYDAPDCKKADVTLNPADSPIRGVETVTTTTASTSRRCVSRRSFRIRLVRRRGRRYRSATITVNGKRVATQTGSRIGGAVNLTGLPAGTFRVVISARLTNGKTLRYTRRYRTCRGKLRPSNRLNRRDAV